MVKLFESIKGNGLLVPVCIMTVHSREINSDKASSVSVVLDHAQSQTFSFSAYRLIFKRFFETILILAALPIVLPVIFLCAIAVMSDGHSPFYVQKRVGRNGDIIRMWKLRTMVPNAHEKLKQYLRQRPEARAEWDRDQKLRYDPRVTGVGRFLRKTSLDELPQLWNVLNGTMSLVGPRPMMVEQAEMYFGKAYYRLRPGITGMWQVSDRNECRFIDRVRYDELYDRRLSFKTDIAILFRTITVVLKGTGC